LSERQENPKPGNSAPKLINEGWILSEALRRVPFVAYAVGIAAIGILAALLLRHFESLAGAATAVVVMLLLMVLLHALDPRPRKQKSLQAQVLSWAMVVVMVVALPIGLMGTFTETIRTAVDAFYTLLGARPSTSGAQPLAEKQPCLRKMADLIGGPPWEISLIRGKPKGLPIRCESIRKGDFVVVTVHGSLAIEELPPPATTTSAGSFEVDLEDNCKPSKAPSSSCRVISEWHGTQQDRPGFQGKARLQAHEDGEVILPIITRKCESTPSGECRLSNDTTFEVTHPLQ
jgi:hypothetical protein